MDILIVNLIVIFHGQNSLLMILCNEFHVWTKQEELKKEGKKKHDLRCGKRFVDGNSGNKQGWSNLGRTIFNELCHEISIRRNEQASIELERRIKGKILTEMSNSSSSIDKNRKRCGIAVKYENASTKKFRPEGWDINKVQMGQV